MNDSTVYPLVVLPLFFSIFLITRFLTTLFHELGHAIPALIFTNKNVAIYLGSYGDQSKSKHIALSKRLCIYFKLNPFKWKGGMVKHGSIDTPFYKEFIILLLGPVFSLVLALIALYIVFSFDLNGLIKLFTVIFFLSAVFDLRNIYPKEDAIVLYDGTLTYNDGQQLKRLLRFRNDYERLSNAYELYDNGNYHSAIELLESLNYDFINKDSLVIAIYAFVQIKAFDKAKGFYSKFTNSPVFEALDSNVFLNIGLVESKLDENELALTYYDKSLELDCNNVYSLSNRGYTYNLFERYSEALVDFDRVIKIDPGFSYAYANRAYAKLKLNLIEDFIVDINNALSIDDKNAYAYRNLGIYYLELEDYTKAIEQLSIAYEIDPDTDRINHYLKIAKSKINV